MKKDTPRGPNPYLNRSTIRDVDSLYGRRGESKHVFSRISADPPQSVSIVGDRRVGKSSLLYFFHQDQVRKRHLDRPDDFVFIFLDLQMLIDKTPKGFYQLLFHELGLATDNYGRIPCTSPDARGFGDVVSKLSASGVKLILLLDEFDRITETKCFGLDFFSRLRALAGNYNVAYVTSSVDELSELCHSKKISDSPFFNIFHSVRLADLTKREAQQLIVRPSKRTGVPLEPYTDFVLNLAGRFPFFIQMACCALFEHIVRNPKKKTPDMRRVKSDFLREAKPHFQYIWHTGFDDAQREVCESLLHDEKAAKDKALEDLIEKGYVSRKRGEYALFSSTFSDFVSVTLGRDKRKTVTAASDRLKPSQKLGGFEILECLGKGGMGAVYKAKRADIGDVVALKILSQHLIAEDMNALRRFRRAANAASKLDHRHIVKGYEVGQFENLHYFVMEYVEGTSLGGLLQQGERFDETRGLQIALQAADALAHAHEARVVHRDIKPGNIMLSHNDTVKIVDFGIAKCFGAEEPWKTRTGVLMGTPYYMSPEQIKSERNIDTRSDIYSLGATLYHILTGEPPFVGPSVLTVIRKHLEERLPSPQEKNPCLSDGVCRLIEKMMAKDKEDRYQTPPQLLNHIDMLLEGKSPFSQIDERTAPADSS